MSIKVFNRWGQIVHEGNTAWDGTFKSETAPSGIYRYIIEYSTENLKSQFKYGEVSLIR